MDRIVPLMIYFIQQFISHLFAPGKDLKAAYISQNYNKLIKIYTLYKTVVPQLWKSDVENKIVAVSVNQAEFPGETYSSLMNSQMYLF